MSDELPPEGYEHWQSGYVVGLSVAEKPTLKLDHRWALAFVPPRVEELARHAEMLGNLLDG